MERSGSIFLWMVSLSVVVVILGTGYKFLIQKDYNFIVEAACDPATETCFARDCSDDECPPNELSEYKTYVVSAGDFEKCADNSCASECTKGSIACEEILCDETIEECAVYDENKAIQETLDAEGGVRTVDSVQSL